MTSYEFWITVAEAGQISILADSGAGGSVHLVGTLDRGLLEALFPEAADAGRWAEFDERAIQVALKRLDEDIAFLRGAGFKELIRESRFTLSLEDSDKTFADLVNATMKSQLARELVIEGYLDRNFALYAAQFYGDFTGVDVATFIVQTVQANKIDIDYAFGGPEAIKNLLHEAPEEFSRTISACNTEILDYLLKQNDTRAADIADTIASNFGDQERKFLGSYLNSGSERASFAALLSRRPWPDVFTYLVQDEGVPVDVRSVLVDAALREASGVDTYDLSIKVRDFIVTNYSEMEVFTRRLDDAVAVKVVALMEEMSVVLPELAGLDDAMRDRIVHHDLYRLTADNLREALGVTGDISFDQVREHADVFDLCRRSPDEYLAAVRNDSRTPHSVLTETTLTEVLVELPEAWDADHLRELIAMAASDSRLERLDSIPASCWPDLAAHLLFRATVRNLLAYRDAIGSVDRRLADLLVQSGSIDTTGEDETAKMNVAIDLLNAADSIPEAGQRVSLVVSLNLEEYVSPSVIEAATGSLLALLLEHNLVEDSLDSFMHFRSVGWAAIEPAIGRSTKFVEFMTPELVGEFIPDFLRSRMTPPSAKDKVLSDLAQYVPGDAASLSAVGQYASNQRRTLPVDQVRRIAAATNDRDLTLKLLTSAPRLAAPSDIVAVLTELGAPYSHLTSRAQHKFEVDADDAHRMIFDHLKKAGLVSGLNKKRLKDVYVVELM